MSSAEKITAQHRKKRADVSIRRLGARKDIERTVKALHDVA